MFLVLWVSNDSNTAQEFCRILANWLHLTSLSTQRKALPRYPIKQRNISRILPREIHARIGKSRRSLQFQEVDGCSRRSRISCDCQLATPGISSRYKPLWDTSCVRMIRKLRLPDYSRGDLWTIGGALLMLMFVSDAREKLFWRLARDFLSEALSLQVRSSQPQGLLRNLLAPLP